ncbi:SRPBCC family protein [Povalibacter sp.]|uniref:SRPBCC family protein n=1 Tax=Povalibacter sp. TaxID=1962978 RepID=UPI002F40239A
MLRSITGRWIVAVALGAAVMPPVHAEIVNAAPNGFNLRHVAEAAGVPPTTVWAALSDIGKWWDPEHTYSGDSRNLSLDPVAGGCFCEKLSLYAGLEHARVVYAQPAKTLRLVGALGPLQEFGVSGALTWQLEAAGGGSRITVTYNVGGFADRPLADWAPIVDEVVGNQVRRLARFVATGNPAEARPEPKP